MNSTTSSTEKSTNKLVSFEICGQAYRLSDYYLGIERNQEALSEHLPTLEEFPYSVRQLKGDLLTHTMDVPVKIVYKGEKLSLGAFCQNAGSLNLNCLWLKKSMDWRENLNS